MRTVELVYEAISDDSALARLPQALADDVGARSAIMIEFDAPQSPYSFHRHGIPDEMQARYVELDLARHDVWTSLPMARGGVDRTVLCEDFIDADAFRQTVFYNELYRPFGDDTARCMGVLLSREAGFMSLGLHRGYRQAAFDARDQAGLDRLLPHLKRLSEVRARLREADAALDLARAALDRLPCAVLIAAADGRVRHANARAEEILRSRDGVTLRQGRLAPVHAGAADALSEAVRSAALRTGARGGALQLPRRGAAPLRLLVASLRASIPGALVLLDRPEDAAAPGAAQLAGFYGLTASEGELAALLAGGATPQEAADARGVRLSTVRTQILSLIAKTDTDSLGDLLRVLGRTPRFAED